MLARPGDFSLNHTFLMKLTILFLAAIAAAQSPALSPATDLALTKMELAAAKFQQLQQQMQAQSAEFQKWRVEACKSVAIDADHCEVDLEKRTVSRKAEAPAPKPDETAKK
jgi:hypothetical protein